MSLVIECDWESAPGVRAAELRATWGRLRISVGDEIVTLVKELESPGQIRDSIDVAAYPLAEWIALNWWQLEAVSHHPSDKGVRLVGAGDGFPWPNLTLRSDRQQMWVEATPRHDSCLRVQLLGSARAVLSIDDVRHTLGRFVDATVRRLEGASITGTLLQDEWAAIQGIDDDERRFAVVAASWGFDPYNIDDEDARALISASTALQDDALLADLARGVPFSALTLAEAWVRDALTRKPSLPQQRTRSMPTLEPLLNVTGGAPWREGYARARALRRKLGLSAVEPVDLRELVGMSNALDSPPGNIEALASVEGDSTVAIVGPGVEPTAPRGRFLGARAIARRITDPRARSSLLTRGTRYTDRLERAFAAEFLAPAAGMNELLGGNFDEDSQAEVARVFGVDELVVVHQIENQLAS